MRLSLAIIAIRLGRGEEEVHTSGGKSYFWFLVMGGGSGMETGVKLYVELATAIGAYKNCCKVLNTEWKDKWKERIVYLSKNYLPSGSGIDCGTSVMLDKSAAEKIVFQVRYHHMNECGMYDGWTEHEVVVTPSFMGFSLRIGGRNRNDIKDYLYDVFDVALNRDIYSWD